MTDHKKPTQNQPEHPSQAEGDRSIGGPGAETAESTSEGHRDPSRERPSQAEGERGSRAETRGNPE